MVAEVIFQNVIFKEFILPFFLIFFIVFAILEKTKLLGDGKKTLNAWTAFIIGLIFVGVAYPKEVVNNMILFLTVAIVVVFVILLIWGFVRGETPKLEGNGIKWTFGIGLIVVVFIALLWATGFDLGAFERLFNQSWSKTFWTNVLFIAVVGIALAVMVKSKGE